MPFLDLFNNMNLDDNIGSSFSMPSKSKGPYAKTLNEMTNIVMDNYRKGIGLNESIARIATQRNLNQEQIKRLIEESNQDAYLIEYGKLKHKVIRDVHFEVASLTKIKDLMNPEDSRMLEERGENVVRFTDRGDRVGRSNMVKRASEENLSKRKPVKFDCFNYSPYDTYGLMPEAYKDFDETKAYREKIAKELEKFDKQLEKLAGEVCASYADLADAFLKIGKEHNNTVMRNAYIEMCKDASFNLGQQRALCDAFDEKVAMAKKAKYIPEELDLSLDLVVDYSTPRERFDLGKYSLSKVAEEESYILTPSATTMKNINSLVRLAEKTKEKQDKLSEMKETKGNIRQIANNNLY